MIIELFYLLLILFVLLIRIFIFFQAQKVAVDQYFWLLYREFSKKQKEIPPDIPYYILDVKQWYPPLFGYFLYILPEKLIKNPIYIMSFLTIIRISIFIALAIYVNKLFTQEFFLSLILYIISPVLVYYDNQITSRILGAIFLDLLVLFIFLYLVTGNYILLFIVFIFNIILMYTHKMSHQLYVFILLLLTIIYGNILFILLYLFSLIISLLFLGYKKYLKAHIEIVNFWDRNKYLLGAHQFYESPIYGKSNYVYKNRLHGKNIKFFIKKLSLIIGFFPFIIFLVFNLKLNYFGVIIFATILFIILTSFIPKMYCLGAGYLYTYNLVSFTAFYIISSDINFETKTNLFLLFVSFLLTTISITKYTIGILRKKDIKDKSWEETIEFLKKINIDRLLVIPFQLPDEVAFKARKQVFWGAHGYGFKLLDKYFPVFKESIEQTMKDWDLGGILIQKEYWPELEKYIEMDKFKKIFDNGKYAIYMAENWKYSNKIPFWAKMLYKELQ